MNSTTEKQKNFIIKIIYIALIFLLIYLTFTEVVPVLAPFIFGFFVAVLLNKPIRKISEKIKVNKKILGAIMLLLFYAFLIFIVAFLGVQIVGSIRNVVEGMVPTFYDVILPALNKFFDKIALYVKNLSPEMTNSIATFSSELLSSIGKVLVNISSSLIPALGNMSAKLPRFFMLFMFSVLSSIFITLDFDRTYNFIKKQIPDKVLAYIVDLKQYLSKTVFSYLKALLILMSITFCELLIGFLILGIKNPIGAAAITAIVDILPVLGVGTILLPWGLIEIIKGNLFVGIGLLVLYVIILVVRNVMEPKVIGKQLGLPPIVTLLSMHIGVKLFGFLGFFIMPIIVIILSNFHADGKIKLWK